MTSTTSAPGCSLKSPSRRISAAHQQALYCTWRQAQSSAAPSPLQPKSARASSSDPPGKTWWQRPMSQLHGAPRERWGARCLARHEAAATGADTVTLAAAAGATTAARRPAADSAEEEGGAAEMKPQEQRCGGKRSNAKSSIRLQFGLVQRAAPGTTPPPGSRSDPGPLGARARGGLRRAAAARAPRRRACMHARARRRRAGSRSTSTYDQVKSSQVKCLHVP
eukprot:SAG22_NODE_210_length_15092_cov_81.740946_5_plen_223_part_00